MINHLLPEMCVKSARNVSCNFFTRIVIKTGSKRSETHFLNCIYRRNDSMRVSRTISKDFCILLTAKVFSITTEEI